MVEIPLVMIFVDMAENALSKIADNPEYREELLTATQSIDDWVQEKLGKTNKRTLQESIQLAMDTSIVRDKETICAIIAVVSTLYATSSSLRGAVVGGTLLARFGEGVFPHINKQEIRFAKPVNEKLYSYFFKHNNSSYKTALKDFDFKKHADFSNIGVGLSSWGAISLFNARGIMEILLNYGPRILKAIKRFLIFNPT